VFVALDEKIDIKVKTKALAKIDACFFMILSSSLFFNNLPDNRFAIDTDLK